MMEIFVPTTPGELIDKLTILRLKSEKMTDAAKLVKMIQAEVSLIATVDENKTNEGKQVNLHFPEYVQEYNENAKLLLAPNTEAAVSVKMKFLAALTWSLGMNYADEYSKL